MAWWLLAPLLEVQKRADGLYRVAGEGDESAVAADGWFAVLTLVAGVVVALVVYLRTRPSRVGPLVALVVGGFAGAVVAWQVGHLLGPDGLRQTARGLAVGARYHGPLDLTAYGVLLAWPMGVVITYFAVAAGAEAGEPEHQHTDPAAYVVDLTDRGPSSGSDVSPGAAEQSGPR